MTDTPNTSPHSIQPDVRSGKPRTSTNSVDQLLDPIKQASAAQRATASSDLNQVKPAQITSVPNRTLVGTVRRPDGSFTERSFYGAAKWHPAVDQNRQDLPAWFILGIIAIESDGNPYSKGMRELKELGLLQLSAENSKEAGVKDHQRQNGDGVYAIQCAVKYYQYVRKIFKGWGYRFATDTDLWRCAYLYFAAGGRWTKWAFEKANTQGAITWNKVAELYVARYSGALRKNYVNNTAAWEFGNEIVAATNPGATEIPVIMDALSALTAINTVPMTRAQAIFATTTAGALQAAKRSVNCAGMGSKDVKRTQSAHASATATNVHVYVSAMYDTIAKFQQTQPSIVSADAVTFDFEKGVWLDKINPLAGDGL